jgi:hypothetical protein
MFRRAAAWRALALALLAARALGLVASGVASSPDGFAFLAKFCFDASPASDAAPVGTIDVSVSVDRTRSTDLMVLFYDDEPQSWPSLLAQPPLSCEERVRHAKNWQPEGLPIAYRPSFLGNHTWHMPTLPVVEHVRPRFWYVVLANCRVIEEVPFEVRFLGRGTPWNAQFSVDEKGLNSVFVGFLFFCLLLWLMQVYAVRVTKLDYGYVHPLLHLNLLVLSAHLAAVALSAAAAITMAMNGDEHTSRVLAAAGFASGAVSKVFFTALLLLLSGGWTISSDKIRNRGRVIVGVTALLLAHAGLLLWDFVARDRASTLYVYESLPGYLLVALDLVAGVAFHVSMFATHRAEPTASKRSYYATLWVAFGLWFLTVPFLVLLAMLLDPWVRMRWVTSVGLAVSTAAFTAMTCILWPAETQEYLRVNVPDVQSSSLARDDDL